MRPDRAVRHAALSAPAPWEAAFARALRAAIAEWSGASGPAIERALRLTA